MVAVQALAEVWHVQAEGRKFLVVATRTPYPRTLVFEELALRGRRTWVIRRETFSPMDPHPAVTGFLHGYDVNTDPALEAWRRGDRAHRDFWKLREEKRKLADENAQLRKDLSRLLRRPRGRIKN